MTRVGLEGLLKRRDIIERRKAAEKVVPMMCPRLFRARLSRHPFGYRDTILANGTPLLANGTPLPRIIPSRTLEYHIILEKVMNCFSPSFDSVH